MVEKAEPAIPALIAAARDRSPDVREAACQALATIFLDKVSSDDDLAPLAKLEDLSSLYLADKPITDAGLVHISRLNKLTFLALPGSVTDAGLKHLAGLTNLVTLSLDGTAVTGPGLEHLDCAGSLYHLSLREAAKFTDAGMPQVAKMTQLRTLNLWGTRVTDEGLAHVKDLKNLEQLILPSGITDAGLVYLEGRKRLTHVNLVKTRVTPSGAKKLRLALPRCDVAAPAG